jgi:hypothetical protein
VAQAEVSTNLADWALWNAPGNDGVPSSVNPQQVQGQVDAAELFFRLRLSPR